MRPADLPCTGPDLRDPEECEFAPDPTRLERHVLVELCRSTEPLSAAELTRRINLRHVLTGAETVREEDECEVTKAAVCLVGAGAVVHKQLEGTDFFWPRLAARATFDVVQAHEPL